MSEDTQGKEGDCQIASFDSSLPQIVHLDCRRNHEDVFKGIWKSWDKAKKTHFQDKYGNVAQFLFVKPDDALLKRSAQDILKVKRRFPGTLSQSDGITSNGDRHLSLFAFAVYGLIVFPKALGYVSVELADFLFHIEKVVNLTPEVLAETIISLNFIRRKGDRRFLGCTQLLFVWMKSHFRCLYKHFRQVFIPLTRPIEEFLESEWPPNQSIEEWVQNLSALTCQEIEWRVSWMIRSTGAISYSSLIVLSQYGYDQYIPGLNRVEAMVQDLGFWKKLKEIRIKWGQTLSFAIRNLFQPFPLENGKRKISDDVAELMENIHDLKMHLRGRDEEIQRLEADPSLWANELQKAQEQVFATMHGECQVFSQQAKDICEQIEELKKESTPFMTENEPTMKLLEVAQAHYQKFIKLMRRKKKNEE
ncbi:hypothetical protein Goari_025176 [Gossypium aridum]|uniref:DUF7745 domain-containing protein n=1 Tax=Gossypium aridum TaxID=34290 RepID=A0A7J8X8D7_GOSAI|nr:hypothetical protein [Gossypium aridum]